MNPDTKTAELLSVLCISCVHPILESLVNFVELSYPI